MFNPWMLRFSAGFAFEAFVSDVAGKLRRKVEFVVNKVFHVNAADAGILK
jgi:hypothetical protein